MAVATQEQVVITVGACPSGLATSACLNKLSIPNTFLKKEDCFASIWKKYSYDRLHLHLPKQFCHLPHIPFPNSFPTYISRKDFIQYLDDYVSHFNISPTILYNKNVEEASFDDEGSTRKWIVKVRNNNNNNNEEYYFGRFLVVASGEFGDPFIPNVFGVESFNGEVMHSTQYKNGDKFKDKSVLVVGSGNSGMEIALDLANYGAKTSIVVRSPVLPAMTYIRGNDVVFENGYSHPFDAIVFATGFKRSTHK